MTKLELHSMVRYNLDYAKLCLGMQSKFAPMAVVVEPDGKQNVIIMEMPDQESKQACHVALQQLVREKKAVAVFTMLDAYVRNQDGSNKREALQIAGEIKGSRYSVAQFYTRDALNRPVFTDLEESSAEIGLFANFFAEVQ